MITPNMPMSEYLACGAYGASDLIKMGRSFAYWKWRKSNPEPVGRPLIVGSATHAMLEAEISGCTVSLIETYVDGSSLTKGFKQFQSDRPRSLCLDQEERALCGRMVKALLDEPEVMRYLKDALIEPTIIRDYPNTSVKVKCRPDYLHKGLGVSINLKTALDASESGFVSASKERQYAWQSAHYCAILTEEFGKPFDEVHILVEKTDEGEPPIVNLFSYDDDTIGYARGQIWALIERIPECERTGVWPGNRAYLQTVNLPAWSRKYVQL